jgi:hypothetical protein
LERDHKELRKKEIKGHPGERKGLEAPSPENATADVLLSQSSLLLLVQSSFANQRQRYFSPFTDPITVRIALISFRLSIHIARLRPNLFPV